MQEPLTDLERRALDYLVEYLRTNTYQPSIREIGRTFSIKSTKTVSELLQSLADKGWIERDPSRSRGVRLLGVELHTHSVSVPMLNGNAGQLEGVEALELDNRIAARDSWIVLMPDDGLRASGICQGDMLLVEPATLAALEDGDIVLAQVASRPVVRRFSQAPVPRLQADDAQESPLVPGVSNVEIVGRVLSVVRRMRAPSVAAHRAAAGSARTGEAARR